MTVIVHCADPRIQATVQRLLAALRLPSESFFRLSFTGGGRNLPILTAQLEAIRQIHLPQRLIICTHEDCRAHLSWPDGQAAIALAYRLGISWEAYDLKLDGSWRQIGAPVTV